MTPEQLARQLTPELAAALQEALQDMRDGVDYPALEAAIAAGDVDAAIKALDIEQGSFAPYIAAALVLYMRTGAEAARGYRIRFDATDPVDFRLDLSTKVAAMTDEQVQKARAYVYDGYSAGKSRREIAQGLAGRIVRGKRQGGVIGLSGAQQSWVEKMRERLASGDPQELRAVLTAKERDKRYDRTIKVAIRDGKRIPTDKIDEITGKYADRLLRKRAKDIATSEATQFAAGARADAVRQTLGKAGLPEDAVSRTWHHSSIYINARPDHVGMSGVTMPGLTAPFVMFDGSAMRYAHDPRGGARNNMSCRCRTTYNINWNYGK